MKILILFLSILALSASICAQKPDSRPKFDIESFNKKFEVVEWLVEYDLVAWKTTDVLMKQDEKKLDRLGQEWFCFQDNDGRWRAVYGRLAEGIYDQVLHFTMERNGKIDISEEKLNQDFLVGHAKALSAARNKLMRSISPNSPRFNQYIRRNTDSTYTVWLLPAFQPDGTAVYGGEATYLIDKSSEKILEETSHFQKNFRGFKTKPAREIWLDYSDIKAPTLGAIFFAWYYRDHFTKIVIDTSESSSMVINANGSHIWIHVEKDLEESRKPAQ